MIYVALNLFFYVEVWPRIKAREEVITLWPDGIGSNLYRLGLKKLPGRDLLSKLIEEHQYNKLPILFLGGNKKKLGQKLSSITENYEIIELPFGTVSEIWENIKDCQFSRYGMIIVSLPAPKQEELALKIESMNTGIDIYCLGGAITMFCGEEKACPDLISKLGMEFIWRIHKDPKRRLIRLRNIFTKIYKIPIAIADMKAKNIKFYKND
jgi:N-acetylglucosaminyldiphosphoundecaprenol N-acetyl-beta-D-mannosaminyltransferase